MLLTSSLDCSTFFLNLAAEAELCCFACASLASGLTVN
jgi:hypothetical protein